MFSERASKSSSNFAKKIINNLNCSSTVEVQNESDSDDVEIKISYLKSKLEKAINESTIEMSVGSNEKQKEQNLTSINEEVNIYEITGAITTNLKKLLGNLKIIRPTSTESERVFSIVSIFLTVKRTSLRDRSLDTLVFHKSK